MKIGILGFGEIGKAIGQFYKPSLFDKLFGRQRYEVFVKDLKRDDGLEDCDILHVAIPYTKDFVKIIKSFIKDNNPSLTIIHSTVPIGTTRKIGGVVVHSPCKGVHPYLYEGIKEFIKYIGTDNKLIGRFAKEHLMCIGMKVEVLNDSRETEAQKLWETTQSFWGIALEKEIKKWCEENKLSFDFIYTRANRDFRRGYTKLGYPEECMQVFRDMPGKVGGHCLEPNCHLLNSKIARWLLQENEHY